MISSLLILCANQKNKIPINSKDAHGSFSTLVARGLIINRKITKDGISESGWEVTTEAVRMLVGLGFTVPV